VSASFRRAFPGEFAEREGPAPSVAGLGGAALGGPLDTRGSAIHPTLEFRVDNRRVKLFEIGGLEPIIVGMIGNLNPTKPQLA
jgi:hypothetical protein